MTLDYFNAFTVTVTPQSVLWKYTSHILLFVTRLYPLIVVRNLFLLNIFRTWHFYSIKSAAAGLKSDSLTILVLLFLSSNFTLFIPFSIISFSFLSHLLLSSHFYTSFLFCFHGFFFFLCTLYLLFTPLLSLFFFPPSSCFPSFPILSNISHSPLCPLSLLLSLLFPSSLSLFILSSILFFFHLICSFFRYILFPFFLFLFFSILFLFSFFLLYFSSPEL